MTEENKFLHQVSGQKKDSLFTGRSKKQIKLQKEGKGKHLFQNANLLILICLYKIEIKWPLGITTQQICDYMPPGHTKTWREVHLLDLEKDGKIRMTISPYPPRYSFFSIDEAGKQFVRMILHDDVFRSNLKLSGLNVDEIDFYNEHFTNMVTPFSGHQNFVNNSYVMK